MCHAVVVATGLLFGLWMEPVSAIAWTCGMLCIHAVIIRNCARYLNEAPRPMEPHMAETVRLAGSALWPVLDAILIHPAGADIISNTMLMS